MNQRYALPAPARQPSSFLRKDFPETMGFVKQIDTHPPQIRIDRCGAAQSARRTGTCHRRRSDLSLTGLTASWKLCLGVRLSAGKHQRGRQTPDEHLAKRGVRRDLNHSLGALSTTRNPPARGVVTLPKWGGTLVPKDQGPSSERGLTGSVLNLVAHREGDRLAIQCTA